MQISLKVSELKQMIKDLEEDKIEYVDISIIEDDDSCYMSFDGYDGEGGGVDFGLISHVDVDAFYKE